MFRKILDWLEERTGVESAIRHFLYEEIPASSGWHQVFGSVALFLFLVQAFTGILLAFNFAPTPGESYNSLKFIITELTGGRLIRGLHHWGASMMIVVVVLHMVQVFLWGAYKKPREMTWMLGVVLLLLTLTYGLTGYLLPWDNRAYWGTVVATQIASKAPIVGQYMARLMGSDGGGIGVITFTRFYALHVLLLPPITLMLIGLHVFLVRKHGVAPAPEDFGRPKKKFYPEQVFKDTVAIFAAFAILFTMAVAVQVPLGRLADPTDSSYIPRPDWYFLFLFQLLKFFEGPLEVVGSVVLPGIAVLTLFLVPFIDRSKAMRVTQRTTAIGVVALAALGWTGLTVAAIMTTPHQQESAFVEGPGAWQLLPPEELASVGFIRKENCSSCHTMGESEAKAGPDLVKAQTQKAAEWLIAHFKDPSGKGGDSAKPSVSLSNAQMKTLAAFLQKVDTQKAEAYRSAPAFAVEGAMLYEQHQCRMCHVLNGSGANMGPRLNGLASRRDREWVEGHFTDPQKYSPGTTMPVYKLPSKDLDRLTSYLMEIP